MFNTEVAEDTTVTELFKAAHIDSYSLALLTMLDQEQKAYEQTCATFKGAAVLQQRKETAYFSESKNRW